MPELGPQKSPSSIHAIRAAHAQAVAEHEQILKNAKADVPVGFCGHCSGKGSFWLHYYGPKRPSRLVVCRHCHGTGRDR